MAAAPEVLPHMAAVAAVVLPIPEALEEMVPEVFLLMAVLAARQVLTSAGQTELHPAVAAAELLLTAQKPETVRVAS